MQAFSRRPQQSGCRSTSSPDANRCEGSTSWEDSEMRHSRWLVLMATLFLSLAIAGCAGMPDGTAEADVRAMPQFEIDPSWPQVPPKWRLGDASSIAIDAMDNV